jgi:hypothetical protein
MRKYLPISYDKNVQYVQPLGYVQHAQLSDMASSLIEGLLTDEKEDPNFDRKLDLISSWTQSFVKHHLVSRTIWKNCA